MCISDSVVRPIVVAIDEVVAVLAPRDHDEREHRHHERQTAEPDPDAAVDDRRVRIPRCARISPGTAASKPRPIASRTSIAKLIQRIWSGVSGAPSADVEDARPDEEEDERAQLDDLDAHVLHQVVVDAAAALRPR